MKYILLKFCLLTFLLAAVSTAVHADIFYKTKVKGKFTHVSLISDTQKIGKFTVNITFSKYKCRATLKGEVIPCNITIYPTKERYGLLTYSSFKVALNLPTLVKLSCIRDNRCEELLNLLPRCQNSCHQTQFEVSFNKVRVLGLNDWSKTNILQIDTASKEAAFHVLSKVSWPEQK